MVICQLDLGNERLPVILHAVKKNKKPFSLFLSPLRHDDRWPVILHTAQKETSVDIYG